MGVKIIQTCFGSKILLIVSIRGLYFKRFFVKDIFRFYGNLLPRGFPVFVIAVKLFGNQRFPRLYVFVHNRSAVGISHRAYQIAVIYRRGYRAPVSVGFPHHFPEHGLLKIHRAPVKIKVIPRFFISDAYNFEFWHIIGSGHRCPEFAVQDLAHILLLEVVVLFVTCENDFVFLFRHPAVSQLAVKLRRVSRISVVAKLGALQENRVIQHNIFFYHGFHLGHPSKRLIILRRESRVVLLFEDDPVFFVIGKIIVVSHFRRFRVAVFESRVLRGNRQNHKQEHNQ